MYEVLSAERSLTDSDSSSRLMFTGAYEGPSLVLVKLGCLSLSPEVKD